MPTLFLILSSILLLCIYTSFPLDIYPLTPNFSRIIGSSRAFHVRTFHLSLFLILSSILLFCIYTSFPLDIYPLTPNFSRISVYPKLLFRLQTTTVEDFPFSLLLAPILPLYLYTSFSFFLWHITPNYNRLFGSSRAFVSFANEHCEDCCLFNFRDKTPISGSP